MSNQHPQMQNKQSSRTSLFAKQANRGFTLIELLMVIAIIGILASITFGVSSGVRNAQNKAKSAVELSAIVAGLEQFKARYGDYPLIDSAAYPTTQYDADGKAIEGGEASSAMLLYALTGRMKIESGGNAVITADDEVVNAPKFIDIEKFQYSSSNADPGNRGDPIALLDPWGNPYMYLYKDEGPGSTWDAFGYHLYSTGPSTTPEELQAAKSAVDGIIGDDGVLEDDFRDVVDREGIIFAE